MASTVESPRKLWVILKDEPVELLGHERIAEGYWWFPKIGTSIPVRQCYEGRGAATLAAIKQLESEIQERQAKLADLREWVRRNGAP